MLIFFLMIRRPPRSTLFPLHDALPIYRVDARGLARARRARDEQVRHLREVGADGLAGDVLAQPDRQRRSEEHTSELQSRQYLVCRLLLEKNTHIYCPYSRKRAAKISDT